MIQKEAAIVGAGLTGLVVAYELAKKGYKVDIYEQSSEIGGLAGGFTFHGTSLEKAYHHLFVTDTDILSLIDELGMKNDLIWFDSSVAMLQKDSRGEAVTLPFNGALDLLKFTPLSFIARIRAGIITLFLQKYKNWKKLTSITAQKWMIKWGGVEVFEKLWSPLLTGKFNMYAKKISMAWLWARIHVRANSRSSILSKEQLAYPRHGFDSINQKLLEKIAELQNREVDDFLFLNASIDKIREEKDVVTVFHQGNELIYDAIIGTIPTDSFQKLVVPEKDYEKIDYLSAVVLAFSSSQSLSKYYWHNVMSTDAPFLVFLQHTNLVPSEWYKNNEVYYIGAYVPQDHEYMTLKQESIEKIWLSYLKELFPSFDPNLLKEKSLFKFKHAQHIVDTKYEGKIAPFRVLGSRVYLSNFSQIFPEDRGVNFAVRAGNEITELVYSDLIQ